jgi:rare lipoprotein A
VRSLVLIAAVIIASACGPSRTAHGKPFTPKRGVTRPVDRSEGSVQHGKGTWYGADWHGRPTASGERFNRWKMTAAHKTLPMNTIVRVTNEKNGRSVTVRINDRGPYGKGRIIDVSEAAAGKLGMKDAGVVPVTVEVLELPPKKKRKHR